MKWQEKFLIATWVVILLAAVVLVPLPYYAVHKVNKACCSADTCATEHHHGQPRPRMANVELKAYYDELNHSYYLDQLPKGTKVQWGDLSAKDYMGLTQEFSDHEFVITVDRGTHPTGGQVKMTIAHETCHIKTWGQDYEHGSKFQSCMVNLATHGAFEGVW